MATTYPNQRTIIVHREPVKNNFLGIKNDNWQAAARNMTPHCFMLYIYLASNRDNYELALSPAAVRETIGMARSTYHDQFHVLVDKGYLVPAHGNTYDFFEVPRPSSGTPQKSSHMVSEPDIVQKPNAGQFEDSPAPNNPQVNTEINNNTPKNNITNTEDENSGVPIEGGFKF